MDRLESLSKQIAQAQGAAVLGHSVVLDELVLQTTPAHIIELLTFLRDDKRCQFHNFISICGADYPAREKRFDVVYQLQSLTLNQRIRIKLQVGEGESVPSACAVFPGALWYERETYDMYGVPFDDHPDLRRLLTDYEFEGFPLRKDFPLTGFVEVRYDDSKKRVVYEPVRLQQEFRDFDFLSPWEGYDNENSPSAGKRQGD
jgi:NADH-quinone oxidoreductase subunit C